jgi:hypothetical protein
MTRATREPIQQDHNESGRRVDPRVVLLATMVRMPRSANLTLRIRPSNVKRLLSGIVTVVATSSHRMRNQSPAIILCIAKFIRDSVPLVSPGRQNSAPGYLVLTWPPRCESSVASVTVRRRGTGLKSFRPSELRTAEDSNWLTTTTSDDSVDRPRFKKDRLSGPTAAGRIGLNFLLRTAGSSSVTSGPI